MLRINLADQEKSLLNNEKNFEEKFEVIALNKKLNELKEEINFLKNDSVQKGNIIKQIKQDFYVKEENYLLRINELTKLNQEFVNQKNINMQYERNLNSNQIVK